MNTNFYMIGHLEISQRGILNKPLWYFDQNNNSEDSINPLFQELKKLSGYQFDNRNLRWSNIYGHEFSISIHFQKIGGIYKKAFWEISVWDHTGQTALLTIKQDAETQETDLLSCENYSKLCEVTENFVKGLINCSGCGKQIKTSEIAGQYFAGRYCQHCWDTKWRAIEANENYN